MLKKGRGEREEGNLALKIINEKSSLEEEWRADGGKRDDFGLCTRDMILKFSIVIAIPS